MAEDRQWLAQYLAQVRSPASESDDDGLVYKDHDNAALQPAPATEAEAQDWSGWEKWLRGHLDNERAEMLDLLAKAMGEVIAEERAAARRERDTELLKVRAELAELRGRTDTLLGLLQTKTGGVVDLPRGFWRRDRDVA
jgi:hypothetical protein